MNTYKGTGIVIGRRSLGEADRLLTVYTVHHGKKTLLAKGVRKISSRRAPYIELFSHISYVAHIGKTFDILTEVSSIDQFTCIRDRLGRIGHAYVAAELMDKLTAENQEHEEVYDLCIRFFKELNAEPLGRTQACLQLEEFKLQLLSLLGFIDLDQNDRNENIDRFIETILDRTLKSQSLLPLMY